MQQKSFTLIEILVVIVIVGILSAFIIVSMAGVSSKAAIAKGQAFSNSIKNSLMMSLVSEWRLDDASGTTIQDQWGTNPGTWYGSGGGDYTSPSWRTSSECVSNGCLAFDGTDDYVDCGDSVPIGLNSFTFSFWGKTARNTAIQVGLRRSAAITGLELQFQIPRSSSANSLFIVTNSSHPAGFIYRYVHPANSNSNTTDNKWHYFVGSCDRLQHKPPDVYLDGAFSNGAYSGYCDQFTDNVPSGAFRIGGSAYFQGIIDDIRIYNIAIPVSRVQQNYYSGLNKLLANQGILNAEYIERVVQFKNNLADK